jgi:hypothetical protein
MNIKFNSIFLVLLFSVILIGCKKEGANTSSNSHGKLEVVGGITHDWGEIKVSTLKDNQLKTSFILKNMEICLLRKLDQVVAVQALH